MRNPRRHDLRPSPSLSSAVVGKTLTGSPFSAQARRPPARGRQAPPQEPPPLRGKHLLFHLHSCRLRSRPVALVAYAWVFVGGFFPFSSAQNEWRAIGVQQSRGWVHYAIHRPEPHIMLFRRPINYQQQQEAAAAQMLAK